MSGIFKAYDIRGVYPEQLDENIAERIGRAVVVFLKAKKIVVGRDMRPHSLPLFNALAKGITEQGADVIDLGMCSTDVLSRKRQARSRCRRHDYSFSQHRRMERIQNLPRTGDSDQRRHRHCRYRSSRCKK